jgi:hypothetical protein
MMAHSARQWEPLRAQQMAQRNYWPQQAQGPPRQQPQLGVAAPAGRGSRTVRTCISSVPLFHTRERLPCERPAGRHVPPRTFPGSAPPGATYHVRHIPSLCAPSWAPRALDPSQSVSAQPGATSIGSLQNIILYILSTSRAAMFLCPACAHQATCTLPPCIVP